MLRPFFILPFILSMMLGLQVPAAHALAPKKMNRQILVATNAERSVHKLTKLKKRKCLNKYAKKHARWMAKKRKLQHQKLQPPLEKCKLSAVAENIAFGFSNGKKTVRAWMKSPGHRRNILTPKYRLIGVGAAKDRYGSWYTVQLFGRSKK